MNYLNRAITSLKRKPGKAVTLFLLLFVLGNLIAGAISIRAAVSNTEANLLASLPTVTNVSLDWTALEAYMAETGGHPSIEPFTDHMISRLASFPYVASYDFFVDSDIYSRELELALPQFPQNVDPEPFLNQGLMRQGAPIENFWLRGVSQTEMFDVATGLIDLRDGRSFTEAELAASALVAVISQEFAQANNLQVGSTLTVENNVWDRNGVGFSTEEQYDDALIHYSETYELEVVGIFATVREFDFSDHRLAMMAFQTVNRIYVPNGLVQLWGQNVLEAHQEVDSWVSEHHLPTGTAQAFFSLESPMHLEAFTAYGATILPEFYTIGTFANLFGNFSSSMDNMGWIADLVLYVAVGATLAIVALLMTLFLKDRQKEIGLYLALGERKGKIIGQLLVETFAVSLTAIFLSLLSGSLLSQGLSRQLLENDLIAQQTADPMSFAVATDFPFELEAFRPALMTMEDMLLAYDTSMNPSAIFLFFGVGIGAILLATIIPLIRTMSMNPKK